MPRISADLSTLVAQTAARSGVAGSDATKSPNGSTAHPAASRLAAAAASTAPAAPSTARPADRAELSTANSVRLGSLLKDLRALVDESGRTESISERDALQARIDQTLASVERLAAAPTLKDLRDASQQTDGVFSAPTYIVRKHTTSITGARILGASFTGQLLVNLQVTQSAQTGALRLSFGGPALDLGGVSLTSANARFVIDIGGRLGAQRLSFASGTTLANIVTTINSFASVTGTSASLSGATGIRLSSREYGSQEFVSVSIVNNGGAVGNGIWTYGPSNANIAGPGVPGSGNFSFALNPSFSDSGRNVAGSFGGVQGVGNGRTFRTLNGNLIAEFDLTTAAAQRTGFVTVALLQAVTPVASPIDPPPISTTLGRRAAPVTSRLDATG